MKNSWETKNNEMKRTEDQMFTPEDDILFSEIGDYMKGYLDIEDVKSDPLYTSISEETRMSVSDFNNNDTKHNDNARFISESMPDEKNEVDKITAEWVNEWKEKQHKIDPEFIERRDFITSSLIEEEKESGNNPEPAIKELSRRNILVKFVLPSAAVIAGAFLIFRMLLPSHDTDKIFMDFYSPISAMTSVTRSISNDFSEDYSSAIESYKKGDYESAATGFSNLLLSDPSLVPARFYMGVTQMELENFDNAVNDLSLIADMQNEYSGDAAWYLGLSYIKKGDKASAEKYLRGIVRSAGFYSERAEKILRRLK